MCLSIPARRATRRTMRPAPWRSRRRPLALTKMGPARRSPFVARLGRASEPGGGPLVRVRLQPRGLGQRGAGSLPRAGGRAVGRRQLAPRPALGEAQRGIGRDLVHPGAHRTAALEALQAAPGPDQRVLEGVFGVVERRQHAVAMGMKLGQVGGDQGAERSFVPPPCALEQGFLVCSETGTGHLRQSSHTPRANAPQTALGLGYFPAGRLVSPRGARPLPSPGGHPARRRAALCAGPQGSLAASRGFCCASRLVRRPLLITQATHSTAGRAPASKEVRNVPILVTWLSNGPRRRPPTPARAPVLAAPHHWRGTPGSSTLAPALWQRRLGQPFRPPAPGLLGGGLTRSPTAGVDFPPRDPTSIKRGPMNTNEGQPLARLLDPQGHDVTPLPGGGSGPHRRRPLLLLHHLAHQRPPPHPPRAGRLDW